MKTFFQLFKITVICMFVAGWMRMAYRPVTLVTWTDLFEQSTSRLLTGMWLMPVYEAVHFYWGYLLVIITFVAIARFFLNNKARRMTFVKLGMLLGVGGYLLVNALTPDNSPIEDGYFLFMMYSMIGGLFGYLYFRWIARPEYKAHKAILPVVSAS